jgi:hypothetical protein
VHSPAVEAVAGRSGIIAITMGMAVEKKDITLRAMIFSVLLSMIRPKTAKPIPWKVLMERIVYCNG